MSSEPKGSGDADSSGLRNMFVSEDDLDEYRRKRQEEWEKIRQPDDPVERPDTIIQDKRSLYERLQEQKDKKQDEWDEQHKFKNLFRGIDGEESEFLDQVAQQRVEENKRRFKADSKEMSDYKNAVSELQSTSADLRQELVPRKPTIQAKSTSQAKLLAGSIILKRKSSDSTTNSTEKQSKKLKNETAATRDSTAQQTEDGNSEEPSQNDIPASEEANSPDCNGEGCTFIWGGLAQYSDSSDSDSSSSDSDIISTKIVT